MEKVRYQILYEKEQSAVAYYSTVAFLTIVMFMNAETRHFDIQNPFGLPGGLSQYLFYGFGIAFAIIMKRKKDLLMPVSPLAGILWISGLSLAAVFAVKPREAYPLVISVGLYLFAGYGIWKATSNDRVLADVLKILALIGLGWSIFILKIFFEYGYLPIEYRARFSFIHNSYDHTFYGMLIINGAIGALSLLILKKGWFTNTLIVAIVVGTFFTVFVSQCRSSLLAFCCSCTYLMLKNENIKKKGQNIIKGAWIVLTFIFVIMAARETSQMNNELMKRFDFADVDYQMKKSSGRPEMLQKGVILILRNPLGVGGYNSRFTSVGVTELAKVEGFVLHNQYLTTIVEGGWIVIFSIVMLIQGTIIKPLKFKWKSPARLGIFCCWLNCSIVAVLAEILGGYYFLMLFLALAAIAMEWKEQNQG